MNKHEAIIEKYPNVCVIRENEAFDDVGNKIIYDEQEIQSYINSKIYIEKRRSEYPPITDYLDGIVKNDQKQIDDYIKKCLAVKQKYPK